MITLDLLTAAALSGLASRDLERHGHAREDAEAIGARAVALAKGALAALEAEVTEPDPKPKGRKV